MDNGFAMVIFLIFLIFLWYPEDIGESFAKVVNAYSVTVSDQNQ
jgi:hypothetical protein